MADYTDPNKEWADINKNTEILPGPLVGETKSQMNWPQAVASSIMVVSICAMLIVLFMVLWGPW